MKKIYFLLAFLFLLIHIGISAQDCPDQDVTFLSQEEVDQFLTLYPDCKELQSHMIIGANINNLNALLGITKIAGGIVLTNNTSLADFSGLDSLVSIGIAFPQNEQIQEQGPPFMDYSISYLDCSLYIRDNSGLSSFDGLSGLDSIPGRVYIRGNTSLENLDGLSSLLWIGTGSVETVNNETQDYSTITNASLYINDNNKLQSITGLHNLVSTSGSIIIHSNAVLQSPVLESILSVGEEHEILTYFGGQSDVYRSLHITSNPQLSFCATPSLCNLLPNLANTSFTGNGEACTQATILAECLYFSSVLHPMYFDINENGILDSNEPFLNGGKIDTEPGGFSSFTNQETGGAVYLSPGNYTLTLDTTALQNWDLTSEFISYDISVDNPPFKDSIYFGVYPSAFVTDMQTVVNSQVLRCNEIVTFDVVASNFGTTITEGTLWLEADVNLSDVVFVDIPDIVIAPNVYGWNFTDLYPRTHTVRQIQFQVPGPDEFPIGDPIINRSEVTYDNVNGPDTISYTSTQILECAYDPNDKLMGPVYPDNYALISDPLFYTIRFQNTGNAEAFNVVIKDEIDENLDISSLQLLSSSHMEVLSYSIDDDRLLTCTFRDIFLPDSTTNFEESQGYVSFQILTNSEISDFTTIENFASIFFDYNPPIITNTTQNIMVTSFDSDQDDSFIWEDCDDVNENISPDLMEVAYDGLDNDCDPATLDDDLDQDGFALADDCDDMNGEINPAAEEVAYDGLDNDCDPATLDDDLDQDGFTLADDCDDMNAEINPTAEEVANNGIDEDCDGNDLIVGLEELDGVSIRFYPNPVRRSLSLVQEGSSISHYSVSMHDNTGKLVYQTDFVSENKTIDLDHLEAGFYILTCLDEDTGKQFAQKILVQGK